MFPEKKKHKRGTPALTDKQKAVILGRLSTGRDATPEEVAARGGGEPEEPKPPKHILEPLDIAGNVVAVLERLPDLNHKQRRIAYMISRGYTDTEVAAWSKCTGAYVNLLRHDPRVIRAVEMFSGGAMYDMAEDISGREVLERAQVRAAEVVAEIMNNALDQGTQLRAAVAVLNRTGLSEKDNESALNIVIDRDTIRLYKKAREEVYDDAEFEIVEDDS